MGHKFLKDISNKLTLLEGEKMIRLSTEMSLKIIYLNFGYKIERKSNKTITSVRPIKQKVNLIQ